MKTEAMLYEKLDSGMTHCHLCAHECKISPSQFGICGVRQNVGGTLYTHVYGEVIASNADPIEKKPLYHFLPGTRSFSIATMGCNFKCGFCQNWQISQISKKYTSHPIGEEMLPEKIVELSLKNACRSISYTYTEPTIFFEYAYQTAQFAHRAGLSNVFVTNGYLTEEALRTIAPFLDAANVDLKSFSEQTYQKSYGARLQPVLNTIQTMHDLGIWIEVTTLVIPGESDSPEDLEGIAAFIAGVSKDIPWHISRFHPDYQYTQTEPTPFLTLQRAFEIGKKAGLRYVYLGNVSTENDTVCYSCNRVLIKRSGYSIQTLSPNPGVCPQCSAEISGVW